MTIPFPPLPVFIETDEENDRYLAELEALMDRDEDDLSPEEYERIDALVTRIQDYETRRYPPRKRDPLG